MRRLFQNMHQFILKIRHVCVQMWACVVAYHTYWNLFLAAYMLSHAHTQPPNTKNISRAWSNNGACVELLICPSQNFHVQCTMYKFHFNIFSFVELSFHFSLLVYSMIGIVIMIFFSKRNAFLPTHPPTHSHTQSLRQNAPQMYSFLFELHRRRNCLHSIWMLFSFAFRNDFMHFRKLHALPRRTCVCMDVYVNM